VKGLTVVKVMSAISLEDMQGKCGGRTMKATRTWVLIADGGRARILATEGHGQKLRLVDGMTFTHELPKTSDLVQDRQTRSFESTGHMRHPVSTGLDPHRKEKEKFAIELAEVLDQQDAKKSFDRLVIVAPAKALGELRAAISAPVRKKVHKEFTKDLTKTPDSEIAGHLEDALA
jgi:protein required for attachment to host cells